MLRIEPGNTSAWYALGNALPAGETIRVGIREVARQDCYAEVLRIEPGNTSAWYALGNAMTGGAGKSSVANCSYSHEAGRPAVGGDGICIGVVV